MSETPQDTKKQNSRRARDPRGNRRPSRGKGDKRYNEWARHLNLAALAATPPWRPQGRRWLTGSTFLSTAAYSAPYGPGQGLHALAKAILPAPGYIQQGIVLDSLRRDK